jgi:hypothetical protein
MDVSDVQFAIDSARTVAAAFPGSVWYWFGSSTTTPETACDIDLLIVHDARLDTSRVREALGSLCPTLPIHLTILTREEEVERGFLARAAPHQRLDVR